MDEALADLAQLANSDYLSGNREVGSLRKWLRYALSALWQNDTDHWEHGGQRGYYFRLSGKQREAISTEPLYLDVLTNAVRAAGWDDVTFDPDSGTLSVRRDPLRTFDVVVDGIETVRAWAGTQDLDEFARNLLSEGVVAYSEDGGWRLIPPGRITSVNWPADPAGPRKLSPS